MKICIKALYTVLFLFMPLSARAEVVIGFYSYDLDLGFKTYFPHAFVVLKGRTSDGKIVDENIGFTAKSVSPAILTGSVTGIIEHKPHAYIEKSTLHFSLSLSDLQYAGIKAIEAKWRARPGKSYNLNKANCIHFVGEIAAYLGLTVDLGKAVIKKPRAFMERLLVLNPRLVNLVPPRKAKK